MTNTQTNTQVTQGTQAPRRNNASRWNLDDRQPTVFLGEKGTYRIEIQWSPALTLRSIYTFPNEERATAFASSLVTSGKIYVAKFVKSFPLKEAAAEPVQA